MGGMTDTSTAIKLTVAHVRMKVQGHRTDEDPVRGYVVLHNAQVTCSGRLIEGIRWQGQAEECGFTLPMEQVVWVKWLEPDEDAAAVGNGP